MGKGKNFGKAAANAAKTKSAQNSAAEGDMPTKNQSKSSHFTEIEPWITEGSGKHHCPLCEKPLSHPSALTRCLGIHCSICPRYHQGFFRLDRGHSCDSCQGIIEAHIKRYREIGALLNEVYASSSVAVAVIPEVEVGEEAGNIDDVEDDNNAEDDVMETQSSIVDLISDTSVPENIRIDGTSDATSDTAQTAISSSTASRKTQTKVLTGLDAILMPLGNIPPCHKAYDIGLKAEAPGSSQTVEPDEFDKCFDASPKSIKSQKQSKTPKKSGKKLINGPAATNNVPHTTTAQLLSICAILHPEDGQLYEGSPLNEKEVLAYVQTWENSTTSNRPKPQKQSRHPKSASLTAEITRIVPLIGADKFLSSEVEENSGFSKKQLAAKRDKLLELIKQDLSVGKKEELDFCLRREAFVRFAGKAAAARMVEIGAVDGTMVGPARAEGGQKE